MRKWAAALTFAFAMLSAQPASAADAAYEWATANGATFVEEARAAATAAAREESPSLNGWLVVSSGHAYGSSASEAVTYLGPAPGARAMVAAVVINDGSRWKAGYVIVERIATTTTTLPVEDIVPGTTPETTPATAPGVTTPRTITTGVATTAVSAPATDTANTTPTTVAAGTSSTVGSIDVQVSDPLPMASATPTETTDTTVVPAQPSVDSTSTTVGLADRALTAEISAASGSPAAGVMIFAGGIFAGAAITAARRRK